ncbi:hypothetical protein IUS38_23330 [Mycobacteroides abscessus subsp. abscessus]|uniref:hypothetical protein n=1 Tax=Mycobacteroides abscessus TaxID=36809 RepID=UPI0019D0C278|nr:hypothetical protein [Mycobacteroides abscessus]MBN7438522.1 hypothetical protein [Mycobacteroides abscessus subsp. abscessus]
MSGWGAASGLFYQYLFTIEKFLTLVGEGAPAATQVRIEDPKDLKVQDPDIVDFSVYSPDGVALEIHQAKSVAVPAESTISAGAALATLVRMTEKADAGRYVLTTNARPGEDIDRLNTLLTDGTLADAEILREIHYIARFNEAATAALMTLTAGEHLDRLRRAYVDAKGESSAAIRKRTMEAIWKLRSSNALPLPWRAACILEGRLIFEVFQRAANVCEEAGNGVTLTQFTKWVGEPAGVLNQAAGVWETGRGAERVPFGEGVVRRKQLAGIVDHFNSLRLRKVLRCTVTGPSGVGKSMTAAMFVHEEADSYDRVCWIDAESEASIASSLDRQRTTIGIPDEVPVDSSQLIDVFKTKVSEYIGRWLIVFDNAQGSRELDPFVPTRGNAHVLVTSLNESNWTEYRHIQMPDMSPDQARELMRTRLTENFPETTAEQEDRVSTALDSVAVKLGRRPLALHIAASHFGSTAALVNGVDSYTGRIDALAAVMDDVRCDRGRYPRTFVAAIHICLDKLTKDLSDPVAHIAADMLNAMAFMGSQSIPAYLPFAVAVSPREVVSDGHDSRQGLQERLPQMNAAIGYIRTQSLADRYDDPSPGIPWELSVQLGVNEIVQFVIRQRMDSAATTLDDTAGHLAAWLSDYFARQQFSSALAIEPHVLHLLDFAKDVPNALDMCPTLASNEASFRQLQGRPAESVELLRLSADLLERRPEPSYKARAHIAEQIIAVQITFGEPVDRIVVAIRAAVESIRATIEGGDTGWGGARVCANLLSVISGLAFDRAKDQPEILNMLAVLRGQVQGLSARFGEDAATTTWLSRMQDIEYALSAAEYGGAFALADDMLASLNPHQHIQRIGAKVMRVEAICGLCDVDCLETAVADLLQDVERNPAVVEGVWSSLINTAKRLALWIAYGVAETLQLREIFKAIVRASGTRRTSTYEHYAHALLAGCEASQNQDFHGAKLLMAQAAVNKPSDKTIGDNLAVVESWLLYWLQCAERGCPAHVATARLRDRKLGFTRSGEPLLILELDAPHLDTGLLLDKNKDLLKLQACPRLDSYGRIRGLEVQEENTGRALSYLVFGDVVEPDSLGMPDDQFGVAGHDGRTILPTDALVTIPARGAEVLIRIRR